jgi:hypothetical protein
MNQIMTQSLQQQLDLDANHQVTEQKIEDNFENGKDYVGIAKTPS